MFVLGKFTLLVSKAACKAKGPILGRTMLKCNTLAYFALASVTKEKQAENIERLNYYGQKFYRIGPGSPFRWPLSLAKLGGNGSKHRVAGAIKLFTVVIYGFS